MTTLGKILVFVNLAFSVVTVSLICIVYATRTNWVVEYNKRVDELKAASGTIASLQAKVAEVETSKNEAVGKLEGQIKDLTGQVAAARETTDQKTKDNAQRDTTVKIAGVAVGNATDAEKRLQDEVKKLQDDVKKRDTEVLRIEQQLKVEEGNAVQSQIAYETTKERLKNMLDEVARLNKEVDRLKTKAPAGAAATTTVSLLRPPPEDVKGQVLDTDIKTGYVTISLGSDQGIAKGHTLEVYRLKPEAKYLGKILILDANHHEAVGRQVGAPRGSAIQKGDTVASSIKP